MGLICLATFAAGGAAAAVLYCVWIVVAAPEGGGVNFALGYVGIAAVLLGVIAGLLITRARRSRP